MDPEIVKMLSRPLFYPTPKTLNSASLLFFDLLLCGTPGPSEIVQIHTKNKYFRDASLSNTKKHIFRKMCQKWLPQRPLKAPEITTNSFSRLLKICVFSLPIYSLICWKMTSISGGTPFRICHRIWSFFVLWRRWPIFCHSFSLCVLWFVCLCNLW